MHPEILWSVVSNILCTDFADFEILCTLKSFTLLESLLKSSVY